MCWISNSNGTSLFWFILASWLPIQGFFKMQLLELFWSLVSIKPITTTTTTNFESKQSDYREGWLLNLIIALFLCRARGICRFMETRPKELHAPIIWAQLSLRNWADLNISVVETITYLKKCSQCLFLCLFYCTLAITGGNSVSATKK